MSRQRKSRIAQLRAQKSFRRNFWRVVLQALAWVGFAVLYYAILSVFFDTPYEKYLKYSSRRLHSEYTALQNRYDSLDMAIRNIEERDENVFNIIFESTPYNFDSESDASRRVEIHEWARGRSITQLQSEFENRYKALEQSVEGVVESTSKMRESIIVKGVKGCSNIPSIQPIVNRQLSLLTASYGMRMHPFYKTMQPHLGVDYTIPEGTRVFATADGVIKSFNINSSSSGKNILIDHGGGYQTYYAHLAKVDLPRSRRVKRGDIIGISGNTGLSLTPHLHYEVRYNGERVDPTKYFFMELNPSSTQRLARIAEQGMQAFD